MSGERNPYLRYRTLMYSYHVALSSGMSDVDYCDLVASLDASVAQIAGSGFVVTPFSINTRLSRALGFTGAGGVWVKDETRNVSGSHKGRHLMGVLIHLAVVEKAGLTDRNDRARLAISSCGNAALAAAVIARAGGWPLTVCVPPDASPTILRRLRELSAEVVLCSRDADVPGDPAYLRLRAELDCGAVPFTTQGSENGLAIEGGRTLGYELAFQAGRGWMQGGLDHIIIQVGGGALASSCIHALHEAVELGVLGRMPIVHTVQTAGVHPLVRAYHKVRALLPEQPGEDAVREAMAYAAGHRVAFMQPRGEKAATSVATGILDDETYDWRAVVEGMLLTGGQSLAVSEELLLEANHLAAVGNHAQVDPTGSAGLAGLLQLRKQGTVGDQDRVAVLLTGIRR
jgi:threonine synthase